MSFFVIVVVPTDHLHRYRVIAVSRVTLTEYVAVVTRENVIEIKTEIGYTDPIDQPLKIKFRNPILQIVDGAADIEIGYLVHGASHAPPNGIPKVAGIAKPVDRVTDVLARPTAAQDEP